MRVADICSHRVVCVEPDASISEAAQMMDHEDVGALVVMREGRRKPIGILTDRDVVMRVVACGKDPSATRVTDAMTSSLATCRDKHDLLDVLSLMRQRGIRRVPVVDARSDLIGIVTSDDVIGALAEHVLVLARSVLGDSERYQGEDAAKNVGA